MLSTIPIPVDLATQISKAEFYVIVNNDGQFLRAKGYPGRGNSWVPELINARIYTKLSTARSRVSYFVNHYPDYPPARIVRFGSVALEIMDEVDRISKMKAKRKRERETADIRNKKMALKAAQRDYEVAQQRLLNAQKASYQ